MATNTKNYDFIKPSVNDPTDEDLWGGYLNENFDSLDTIIKTVSDRIDTAIERLYPVGSIYVNKSQNINPSELLGFGTWVALAGRTIVGIGEGIDANNFKKTFTANETGGEYNHKLTIAEMPSHSHEQTQLLLNTSPGSTAIPHFTFQTGNPNLPTFNKGDDLPHNNIQPYLTAYMWERTA